MKGLLKIINDKVIENALRSDVTVTAAKAPNRRTWIQIEIFEHKIKKTSSNCEIW